MQYRSKNLTLAIFTFALATLLPLVFSGAATATPSFKYEAYLGGPSPSYSDGQLNAPTGVATAPDGRLYVADSSNFRVQAFASYEQGKSFLYYFPKENAFACPPINPDFPDLGKFDWLCPGTAPGQFISPRGMAHDGQGRL